MPAIGVLYVSTGTRIAIARIMPYLKLNYWLTNCYCKAHARYWLSSLNYGTKIALARYGPNVLCKNHTYMSMQEPYQYILWALFVWHNFCYSKAHAILYRDKCVPRVTFVPCDKFVAVDCMQESYPKFWHDSCQKKLNKFNYLAKCLISLKTHFLT